MSPPSAVSVRVLAGLLLIAVVSAQELESVDHGMAMETPAPTRTPFVCTNPNGRAARIGKCGCWLLFTRRIRIRQNRKVRDMCLEAFGRKRDIRANRRFCKPFRRPLRRVNVNLVLRRAQFFLDKCDPEGIIMLMLKAMMGSRST